jgi:hypothetical protein
MLDEIGEKPEAGKEVGAQNSVDNELNNDIKIETLRGEYW